MDFVLPKQMILLRAKNNNLMGFRSKGKSFVVGFKTKKTAQIAARNVSYDSKIFMRDVEFEDIKTTMDLLDPEMKEVPIKKLLVDTNAKLYIEKTQKPEKLVEQHTSSDEFLMYPISKNVGVVIVEALISETAQQLIFEMHVIAPTFSPDMFDLE